MRLLLIGAGNWGKVCIKTLNKLNIETVVATKENYKELINSKPDGVIISTQPDYHVDIAKIALRLDIPTMIEKPLALSYQKALELKNFDAPILVNNIHLFADEYQNIKNSEGNIYSVGIGNGPIKSYSSLYDYGAHDLSMILDKANEMPRSLKCLRIQNKDTDLFSIEMDFRLFKSNSLVGNGAGIKRRIFCIGNELYNGQYVKNSPLENAIKVFLKLINNEQDEREGVNLSINVMKLLDLCDKSSVFGKRLDI
jgi:Oxidoreductase family, NAD-binding Rossmann fold